MAETMDKKSEMDSEMLENLDFLLAMDAAEEEDNWDLLEKDEKDPDSLKALDELSQNEDKETGDE